MRPAATCKECGGRVGPRNKSGYCRNHAYIVAQKNPAFAENQRAGIRRKFDTDPIFAGKLRARARELGVDRRYIEKRAQAVREGEYWKIASAAAGPAGSPSRLKAGRKISAHRLAWCPAHLRDDYRQLVNSRACTAAEARVMIEEQHELEMARWRRSVGAEQPAPPPVLVGLLKERIVQAVAHCGDVSVQDILSDYRGRNVMIARHAAAVLLSDTGMSSGTVGRLLKRHHSSILHSLKNRDEHEIAALVENAREIIPELRKEEAA